MKKSVIFSFLVIAAIFTAGGFALSQAFFSDVKSTPGATFEVGTLEMSVGGENGTEVQPVTIDNIGNKRDIEGGRTWTVKNEGTLPGRLYFKVQNLINKENGCNTPEAKDDATCDNPGEGQGELGGLVNAQILLDQQAVVSSTLTSSQETVIEDAWNTWAPVYIAPGDIRTITVQWNANENDYGNAIQSDSLTFDTIFEIVQLTEQELQEYESL